MRVSEIVVWLLVLLSFVIGFAAYPYMPGRMASHWGFAGQADGYMSRAWGVFLFPVIILLVALLMVYVVRLDPLRKNIEKFRKQYDLTIIVFVLFMLYLYCLTLLWNLGLRFNMVVLLVPGFAVLFYFIGVLVGSAKRNYMIGIRTPWTLENDLVWDKTHKLGGTLFRACAALALLGIVFPRSAILLMLVPVVLSALYLVLYSYLIHRKLAGKKRR
jgi:uncharacterized membrane protein